MVNKYKRRDFLKLSGLATVSVLSSAYNVLSKDCAIYNPLKTKKFPFIFGAQYYRAPTPDNSCWEPDFNKMNELGFTDVKFWIQWRWSHHTNDKFVFDDLDKLMDLAHSHEIRVTLNTIFDASPQWIYEKYPDAMPVMNNGHVIESYTMGHRQIGGHPGPCYNHPGALAERKKFMRAVISHFAKHPALAMWDVWNEPELSFPQRTPDIDRMACYCSNCQQKFIEWLQAKYSTVENLNEIWGRYYENWHQVEVPRSVETFTDFIDWREFHNDTITAEARWRLEIARELDPDKIHYLHVVPNTLLPFNPVSTCADDFELAKLCDVFAATMNNGPFFTPQVMSAGQGKICYNVESHINGGNTNMHQAEINLPELLNDFLPQIGMGIKGFMFWQFRPEMLGLESPAWGLINPDGSDRAVTKAAKTLWTKLATFSEKLMNCFPKPAEIGIWKSRKNEIFQFCLNKNFNSLADNTNAYAEVFYWNSYNYRYINETMLETGDLAGIKLLILPSCYYMTDLETSGLNKWIQNGGVAIAEAHLSAYSGTKGRHSKVVPGGGLAERWNLREVESISSYRLKLNQSEMMNLNVTEDTRKLLKDFGVSGAKYFPIRLKSGNILWGAERYAKIESTGSESLGWFHNDYPCIIRKELGNGTIFYCGTNMGEGSRKDRSGFMEILHLATQKADILPNTNQTEANDGVRIDTLFQNEKLEFMVVRNNLRENQTAKLNLKESYTGLFSGLKLAKNSSAKIPASFCDIFYR